MGQRLNQLCELDRRLSRLNAGPAEEKIDE
jgi:hypothetical protein